MFNGNKIYLERFIVTIKNEDELLDLFNSIKNLTSDFKIPVLRCYKSNKLLSKLKKLNDSELRVIVYEYNFFDEINHHYIFGRADYFCYLFSKGFFPVNTDNIFKGFIQKLITRKYKIDSLIIFLVDYLYLTYSSENLSSFFEHFFSKLKALDSKSSINKKSLLKYYILLQNLYIDNTKVFNNIYSSVINYDLFESFQEYLSFFKKNNPAIYSQSSFYLTLKISTSEIPLDTYNKIFRRKNFLSFMILKENFKIQISNSPEEIVQYFAQEDISRYSFTETFEITEKVQKTLNHNLYDWIQEYSLDEKEKCISTIVNSTFPENLFLLKILLESDILNNQINVQKHQKYKSLKF